MSDALEALLQEGRTFPPPGDVPQARASTPTRRSTTTPSATGRASGRTQALALDWTTEWETILEWDLPFAKWFVGGKLNVVVQLPRPSRRRRPRRPGRVPLGGRARRHAAPSRTSDLLDETCRVANAAARRSASRRATGSRSTWAWSPRPSPTMLACARIGAPHSVVFGGFTAQSLKDRINDARGQGAHHRRRRVAARRGRAR